MGVKKSEPLWLTLKKTPIYELAVSIVQPFGTPLTPVTFQVAALFLTNVPFSETL